MPAKIPKSNQLQTSSPPQNQANPFLNLLGSKNTQKKDQSYFTSEKSRSDKIQKHLKNYLLAVKSDGCSQSTVRNYRSDINQFLDFLENPTLSELGSKPKLLAFALYQREKGLKDNTVKRKLVSITQFKAWLKEEGLLKSEIPLPNDLEKTQTPDVKVIAAKAAIATKTAVASHPLEKKPVSELKSAKKSKPKRKSHSSRFSIVLNLLALALFLSGLAYFAYQQFGQAVISMAYPTTPTRPNRILSFQGRLTNTAQTPIASETDLSFKLYDANTAGTQLWSSNTCAITPDADGIFTANLGAGSGAGADDESCGAEIASSVFSENSNVWLEVTVGSGGGAEILDPRQPIRTVAYALNAETLQGIPVAATAGANTILMMNNDGEVILGSDNPAIKTSSGKDLTLEANSFTIQTQSGSDGDIIFSPDGLGNVQINSDLLLDGFLAAPGATLSANYAGGTALVLKGGPSGTGNIMEWQNNAGTALGVIDENGYVGIGMNNPQYLLQLPNNGGYLNMWDINGNLKTGASVSSKIFTDYEDSAYYLDPANSGTSLNIAGAIIIGGTNYSQYFIDSAGTSGQVWNSDGTGRGAWSDLSSLSVGNADTLDTLDSLQFLRSDTSDNFTSGTLAMNSGTVLDINGALSIADTDIALDGASTNFTSTGNLSFNTSQLFINKSTGNVGIGTNAPGRELVVNSGNATTYLQVTNDTLGATSGNGLELAVDNVGTAAIIQRENADLYLRTNNTNRVVIEDDGDVGIGTISPGAKLHITGSADDQQLIVQGNSTQTANLQEWQNSGGTALTVVDADGKIGINNTSPSSLLSIGSKNGVDRSFSSAKNWDESGGGSQYAGVFGTGTYGSSTYTADLRSLSMEYYNFNTSRIH